MRYARPRFRQSLSILLTLMAFPIVSTAETALEGRIRNRIESAVVTDSFEVMEERIHARETMRRVYANRLFAPIWVSQEGLSARGEALSRWLSEVPRLHGLRPADYHLSTISVLEEADRLAAIVDLELAMSDAFLMVGSHFLAGRLNPETLDAEWVANRRHRDLTPVIELAASSDTPGDVLEALLPTDAAYRALVERLAELRDRRESGGWPAVSEGATLREGDSGPRVAELVRRLHASGDLDRTEGDTIDAEVGAAIRAFQSRHGLAADGLVGRATQSSLNVPVQSRIDQVIVNLERWRWLPEDLGDFHILVNIAGFRLDVVENGQSIRDMRVVVGRPYRRTPVFSDAISYIVLNPYWEVPIRIAIQDKLPLIKSDPGYLAQQGYTLLQGWGDQEEIIDPASVDWSAVTARNFSYRLRQSPGPLNALGRLKFMFPNKFSVYLHDTPARELFAQDALAFSSGCIRLEAPLDLAEILLRDQGNWSREAIDRAIASGREETIRLPTRVPVHLLYWTAWISSDDGALNFRDDIYSRDAPVLAELREAPPSRRDE
jgi:murein L,D-transpeptidase YcbB/YkuD